MNSEGDFVLTIGGRSEHSGELLPVFDPATEDLIASVPDCSRHQLDRAVDAARDAFTKWRTVPLAERQEIVRAMGRRITENSELLARLLTLEQGKPLDEARFEIDGAGRWCQAVASQDIPETLVEDSAMRRIVTRHVPIGVVGAIAPWNFPFILAWWKVAPALVAGNSVVLKPSPFTPLASLKAAELLQDVLPPGVLNTVSGGDALGPWVTEHPDIDKISFTGSTHTGRAVMRSAAGNLKRLTLELGGNDPAIVLPDFDVEGRIGELFWAAFRNSGQICMAAKRMYVHDAIYNRVAKAMTDYAATVRIGNGFEPGVAMGPVQNRPQFERVLDLMRNCREEGLSFLAGGEQMAGKGLFVPITIIDNPPDSSRVVTEEAFGPVLPLLRYSEVDEVIARANDSPFGLAASIWTEDTAAAASIASRLDCGTVWTNEIHFVSPLAPFGGHKQSGIGVESGMAGLLEYTNTKTFIERKPAVA